MPHLENIELCSVTVEQQRKRERACVCVCVRKREGVKLTVDAYIAGYERNRSFQSWSLVSGFANFLFFRLLYVLGLVSIRFRGLAIHSYDVRTVTV